MAETLEEALAAAKARKAQGLSYALDVAMRRREASRRAQPEYVPPSVQDKRMERPSVLMEAGRRAVTTDPALRLGSRLLESVATAGSESGIALGDALFSTGNEEFDARIRQMARERVEELSPFALSSTQQAEYLARREELDPALQMVSEEGRRMAAGGWSGAAQAGALGLQGGAEVAFAAQAPIAVATLQGVSHIPGAEEVLALPAEAGGAVARLLGAEEGGAAEALARAAGSLAPAAVGIPFAKRAGRTAGITEAAARAGSAPLRALPRILAEEGGAVSALRRSPTLQYQGASLLSALPQLTVPQEFTGAASALGADPEVAELIGAAGGIASFLPGLAAEKGAYRRGALSAARARALEGAASTEPGVVGALDAMEAARADQAARPDAALGVAEALGRAAETVPQGPPLPGVPEIAESMRLGAATTRAAEALQRPPAPLQPRIRGAEAQAEGGRFRPGDFILWWEGPGAGVRRYGTVEGVSPDQKMLRVRSSDRRTPRGVPADAADIVKRGPEPLPRQPVAPEPGPEVMEGPRETPYPQVRRQPGIAPEAPPEPLRAPPRTPAAGEPPGAPPPPMGAESPPAAPAAPATDFRTFAESKGVAWEQISGKGLDDALLGRLRSEYAASRGEVSPVDGTPPPAKAVVPPPPPRAIEPPARPPTGPETGAVPTVPPAEGAPAPPPTPVRPSAARARRGSVQDVAPAKPTPFSGVTSPADSIAIQSSLIVNSKIGRGDVARILRDSMREQGTLPADRAITATSPEVQRAWDDLILNGKIDAEGNSLVKSEIERMRDEKVPPKKPVTPQAEPPAAEPPHAPTPPGGEAAPAEGAAPRKAKPSADGGTTLGSGFGALQSVNWKSPQVHTVLRSYFGAAGGYLAALAAEGEDDDPVTRWARRIGFASTGALALGGMPRAYGRLKASAARLRRPKMTPEMASEIRQNVTELRAADSDAVREGNRLIQPKEVFKDPEDRFVWNEYLRDSHGSETPFLELIERVDDGGKNRVLARELIDTAEAWREFSRNLGDEGVATGRVSPEAREQRPGGHLTRITQEKAEGARGWFARFRKSMPKFTPEKTGHDAWGGKVTLTPDEVVAELANLGIPDPRGKRDHYLKGDESGTLIKFPPTQEGFDQASRFFERAGELEKIASERKITAGRIRGGGDPRMVVQVGKGRNADIGHLAESRWDDRSLRLKMPRALAKEIAAGVKVDAPKITDLGNALRAEFATPQAREAFLDGVREVAVEGATFNVTPEARRWFAQRLKGATVRVGPGSSGGATGRIIVETFGPRSAEGPGGLKSDVQDPVVRGYITALQGGRRNAQARHLTRIAFGEDARGPWSIEVEPGTKAGERVQRGDANYIVQENAPELGDLRGPEQGLNAKRGGRALREDWSEVLQAEKATAPEREGFWRAFVGKTKTGKTSTSAGTIFNNVQNILFHFNSGTGPWRHPVEYIKVAKDFLVAHAKGDLASLNETYGKDVGFRLGEGTVLDADAAEGIRAILRGAETAQEVSAARRSTVGRVAADVIQQGVLADPGPPGWKRTVGGLGISTGAGAIAGGLVGAASQRDDETLLDSILRGGRKGALWGLGGGAAARTGRAMFRGTDPFHRAVAFKIITTSKGPWGEPLTPQKARDYLHRKFQDFENMDPRVRAIAGQDGGVGAALVNEFAPAYFETARVMGNNFADNPALATASLLALPAFASIVAYAAGTFGSEEERRASKEAAPFGAFFRRAEDGTLYAFDTNRMTGADVAVDLGHALGDAGHLDSWREILTDFGGSMIGTTAFDTAHAAFNPEARSLRYGQRLRKPGRSAGGAALETLVRGLSSPYSPQYGTTATMLREGIEEPFVPGRSGEPAEPKMSAVRAISGLKREKIDFEKIGARLNLGRVLAHRLADREFSRATADRNIQANPARMAAAQRAMQEAKEAANRRFEEELRRLTPQPAGASR